MAFVVVTKLLNTIIDMVLVPKLSIVFGCVLQVSVVAYK